MKKMYQILLLLLMILLCMFFNLSFSSDPVDVSSKENEHVILLHGMGRTERSMKKFEKYFQQQGYKTLNSRYPSTKETIEKIASSHVSDAVGKCRKEGAIKIHVVTHSLGGIVVRQYLQTNSLPKGSRIVMLSPPNKGSELADFFKGFFLYEWLNGPAGNQLGTDSESVPNSLEPVNVEVGVITGNKSLNPIYSAIVSGKDDGKVSVERAKLDEMTDFLVVPASHSFIMNDKTVMKQAAYFLKYGRFFKDE